VALQRMVGDELRRRNSPEALALAAHVAVSTHAKFPASLIAWIGASLALASGETIADTLTREQFEKQHNGVWPDH